MQRDYSFVKPECCAGRPTPIRLDVYIVLIERQIWKRRKQSAVGWVQRLLRPINVDVVGAISFTIQVKSRDTEATLFQLVTDTPTLQRYLG